jgi:hypothetical protein
MSRYIFGLGSLLGVAVGVSACSASNGKTGSVQSNEGTGGASGSFASGGQSATNPPSGGAFGNGGFGNGGAPFGNGGSPIANGGAPIGLGGAPIGLGGTTNLGGDTGLGGAGAGGIGGTAGAGGTIPSGGTAGTNTGGSGGTAPPPGPPCGGTIAPQTDYSQMGPYPVTGLVDGTGPNGMYTVIRPSTLGANGFKHPIATWGNGITTTPQLYPGLLAAIASQGIVVIASDSSSVTSDLMTQGLDWMIQQNSVAGDYQGKLNTTCLITIGYSLGGGAAVTAGAHANVAVTVSFHGVTGASNTLHSPLLLMTSDTDTFVVPATFVTPTFNLSDVLTFYGTLSAAGDPNNLGHLIPVLDVASHEQPAAIAWLRLWVYGDQNAKSYFYGDDCVLCKAPWDAPQRKNWQ